MTGQTIVASLPLRLCLGLAHITHTGEKHRPNSGQHAAVQDQRHALLVSCGPAMPTLGFRLVVGRHSPNRLARGSGCGQVALPPQTYIYVPYSHYTQHLSNASAVDAAAAALALLPLVYFVPLRLLAACAVQILFQCFRICIIIPIDY